MIKVVVSKEKIDILGHAMYAEFGKDIVCAAVSSTVITTVNAILSFGNTIQYKETKDGLSIQILKKDHITKTLLDNMIKLLQELEENYEENIKILFKEV